MSLLSWIRNVFRLNLPTARACSLIRRGDFVAARDVLFKVLDRRDEIQDVAFRNKLLELLAWTWTLTDEHRERAVFFSEYLSRYPTDLRAHT